MQENAIYSVISPEGCAPILWRDGGEAKKAAAALKPDARHCLELGVIDEIVAEPEGGAQKDHDEAAALLKAALVGCAGRARGRRRPTSCDARGARSSAPWASSPERGLPAFHSVHRVFNGAKPLAGADFPISSEQPTYSTGCLWTTT